jgi:hypothetical protein
MAKKKFANLEIDIDDSTFLFYAKEAHRKDVTFNQLINEVLQKALDKEDKKSSSKTGD